MLHHGADVSDQRPLGLILLVEFHVISTLVHLHVHDANPGNVHRKPCGLRSTSDVRFQTSLLQREVRKSQRFCFFIVHQVQFVSYLPAQNTSALFVFPKYIKIKDEIPFKDDKYA